METINSLMCQICGKNQAIGVFRNKWVCGYCLLEFENRLNQERNKFLDIIEDNIKNGR